MEECLSTKVLTATRLPEIIAHPEMGGKDEKSIPVFVGVVTRLDLCSGLATNHTR